MQLKKIFSLIISSTLICYACNNKTYSSQTVNKLYEVSKMAFFSSPTSKDKFILSLSGKDTLNGDIIFAIISNNIDTIWKDTFKGRYLLDLKSMDLTTEKEKSDYIITKMESFFNNSHFSVPAILHLTEDTKYFYDEKYLEELKNNKSSIGFEYSIADENNKKIAYSQKLKKVVTLPKVVQL